MSVDYIDDNRKTECYYLDNRTTFLSLKNTISPIFNIYEPSVNNCLRNLHFLKQSNVMLLQCSKLLIVYFFVLMRFPQFGIIVIDSRSA